MLLTVLATGCHLVMPFEPGDSDGSVFHDTSAETIEMSVNDASRPADGLDFEIDLARDAELTPDGLCAGCWSGGKCTGGTSIKACGHGGITCKPCVAPECKKATCTSGDCKAVNEQDGKACGGGTCRGGTCCTGCWDGVTCQLGSTTSACGKSGGPCSACKALPGSCNQEVCDSTTATCLPKTKLDGSTCSVASAAGTCHGGQCCTGCWDTATTKCIAAVDGSCGSMGQSCKNSVPCLGGTGRCLQGNCCTGCITASATCIKVLTNTQCAPNGTACVDCTGVPCFTGFCKMSIKACELTYAC